MLCDFLQCVTATSALCLLLCGCATCCCRSSCFRLVHVVFIGTPRKFGTLDFTCESTACELLQVNLFHIISKNVLCGRFACDTAENYAIEQRVSAEPVVPMHTASHL